MQRWRPVTRRGKDDFFEIVDRRDNLIITGGEHVYPSEVEKVIGSHKSVFDVAIFGLPHERWGDCIGHCASVTPAKVAEAAGVTFDEGFLEHAVQYLKKAGYHKPSMLQDVERGALTEIDWINGKSSSMPSPTTSRPLTTPLLQRLSRAWR